jgi:hypothetical protein
MKIVRRVAVIVLALGCESPDTELPRAAAPSPSPPPPAETSPETSSFRFDGDRFRATIDPRRGGELTELTVFDGRTWNRVLGGDGQTFPAVVLRDDEDEYALALSPAGQIEASGDASGVVTLHVEATPRAASGRASSWRVALDWELHAEGAVFVSIEWQLATGASVLSNASVSFALDESLVSGPRWRDHVSHAASAAMPSYRAAFGVDPTSTFTNEVEAFVEDGAPLHGAASFTQEPGRVTWHLTDAASIAAPFRYTNRLALGVGAARASTALVGQRPYHWVASASDRASWYPTNDEIDRMADNGATMLLLHNMWMANGGSNGDPHADYTTARDETELRRAIAHAHDRGLRVGLYMRGIERYARFFERYLARDRDGIYVDWHGPQAISFHESTHAEESVLGDVHFSSDGRVLPAHDYFQFVKSLRATVGDRGFLLGHQGTFRSGVFSNLLLDAYLAGETEEDHAMLTNVDEAAIGGMTASAPCMTWTVDAPEAFTTPEALAKMAAWGIFPDVALGIHAFPEDPTNPVNAYALPLWRILAAAHAEDATIENAPSSASAAVVSTNPAVRAVAYRQASGATYLVASNLSGSPASAMLTYVDDGTTVDTGTLAPWAIAGFAVK